MKVVSLIVFGALTFSINSLAHEPANRATGETANNNWIESSDYYTETEVATMRGDILSDKDLENFLYENIELPSRNIASVDTQKNSWNSTVEMMTEEFLGESELTLVTSNPLSDEELGNFLYNE